MEFLINIFINLVLLANFTVGHSYLLTTNGRAMVQKIAPAKMFNTVYSLHASITLLIMMYFWRPLPGVIWNLDGIGKDVMIVFYFVSWIFMTWSIAATGALKHNGIEQWWNTLFDKSTRYSLLHGGPYYICRHPIYFSFLGMIWFCPKMSSSHLLLAISWSFYIVLGTFWKEQRLLTNKSYKEYAQMVSPYPLLPRKEFRQIVPLEEIFKKIFGEGRSNGH